MLSVVPNTLCSKVRANYTLKMPRVVTDQRGKFENDELFRKLSRECEVSSFIPLYNTRKCFTSFTYVLSWENKLEFLLEVKKKKLWIYCSEVYFVYVFR